MIKRTIVALGIAGLLFGIPHFAFASNIGYFGTTSTTTSWITPDSTNFDDYWIDIQVGGGSGQVIWLGPGDNNVIGTSSTPGTVQAPDGAIALKLKSLDGTEVYAIVAHSTNPADPTVYFSGSQGGGGDTGGGSSGGNTYITNNYYDIPGWNQYMGKLDEILNAIPPVPNWGAVANTFRDSIAPAITADMANLLGSAPTPGAAPTGTVPTAPNVDVPSDPPDPAELSDRGITVPTGQQADGLNESAFTYSDVKNQADVIEERQDDSGGFHILNPIDGLPSQEEFKQHSPQEGDAPLPANPKDPDNYSPNPQEQDNPAPNPTEGDNVAPNPSQSDNVAPKPSTSDNVAPKPSEGDNAAPSPNDSDNYAPSAPIEQENHSPKPSSSDNVAPTPGGSSGGFDSFPKPSGWGGGAPVPAADNSKAPLPNQDSGEAPIPGG